MLQYDGATGAFVNAFVTAGSGLTLPTFMVLGPDGNLYVAGLFTNQVLRYNGASGAFIDVFAGSGGLNLPFGLLFFPDPTPTLSEWGQILMVGVLVASGVWVLRRRRLASAASSTRRGA